MFPFFPRYFWVPPLICGILATGCAAGTAWNAHHHTHFYASGESGQSCTGEQADESQAGTDKRQNSDKSQAKTNEGQSSEKSTSKDTTDNQMDRVIEIMKASAEGCGQILSDMFKD